MTRDAFVSYAHDDKSTADAVCAKLEEMGIACWIAPRDAVAGVDYPGQLVDAITAARVLVLILSSRAMQSRQVRSEVERAFSKGIAIVPLRIEDVAPSTDFEYLIGSVHWLDAFAGPLEDKFGDLVSAVHGALAGETAARPELRANPTNLPAQVNRLIGRDIDVAAIEERLANDRLVTVTGAGGVGKTRIAVEVGRLLLATWRDGVWFVQLAAIADPSLVTNAVAQGLGTPEGADRPLREMLFEHLKDKRLLLLLDNCEHVIAEAGSLVSATLAHCAEVQVLATSRESLKVGGEWTYRLPSLGVPPLDGTMTAEQAVAIPAIALFVERARAADARFVLADGDVAAVAEICRRLDGIPFAVELAAARVAVLTPRELAKRLEERFRVLKGGDRDAVPHHQTMRACIEWSYDLLSPTEQTLFRRIAIFPAGCTLAAAEEVCADGIVEADDVLDLLSSLVSKSLVASDLRFETARYRLLESTREYALQKLTESGEDKALARRHAEWVAAFVRDAREAGFAVPVQRWLAGVLPESDSIRATLVWALGPGDDLNLAAHVAADATRLWFDGGLQADGREWIEAILPRVDEPTQPGLAAMLWHALGTLRDAKPLLAAARRALALFEQTSDLEGAAKAYLQLAYGLWQTGDLAAAEAAVDKTLALHREAGFEKTWHYGNALDTKGSILSNGGKLAEAGDVFQEALAHCAALGDEHGVARIQINLAELQFALGQPVDALRLAQEAAATFRRLGARTREAVLAINAASYQLALGLVEEAERSAREGLSLSRATGQPLLAMTAVFYLAVVAGSRHNAERAAHLLGYVDAWCAREGYERDRTERVTRERLWTQLETELGGGQLAALTALGARLSEAEATTLATAT